MEILTFLKGKKTYILVACALVVVALHMVGMLDVDTTDMALVALGFGGLATLRSSIKNALDKARGQSNDSAPPAPPAA